MDLTQAKPQAFDRVRHIDLGSGPYPWPETALNRALRAGQLQLAISGGEAVGFLVSQSVLDETTLMHLAVASEHQRQGWGRQMLDIWLQSQRSAGQRQAILEVRRSNQAAIALYQSLGFGTIGQRKGYYAAPQGAEDALVMALSLTD
ncbi:ribosomal protein S18-alanine N-acetyltransferase [Saccharospirillum impatiens]|uniref:ribosomal protein S18-alanine N-acetyltransferase n=1 Tax=Saccharospirillum impatiens TaxID=169438 RepID=UPI0003F6D740|nr:ribosomal protein S18-alanine N-acetyltransferase [Saccharospirillum impatiens]